MDKYLLGAWGTSGHAIMVLMLETEHLSWMSHAFAAKFGYFGSAVTPNIPQTTCLPSQTQTGTLRYAEESKLTAGHLSFC